MKNFGMCTRNVQGLFEVSYEFEPTLMDKVLRRQTKFTLLTRALNKFNWKSFASTASGLDWFDPSGYPVSWKQKSIAEAVLMALLNQEELM